MDSAAAIIEALNARATAPGHLHDAARASWGQWMSRLASRPGRITGAPAQDLVDQLASRPVAAPPRRSGDLNRWQAFATLWRQQWHPASSDERRWRWTASGTSFVWHIFVVLLFISATALHFMPPKPEESDAIQVEYIGVGTPAEEGGGEPPAPGEQGDSPSEAARASSSSAAAATSTPTPSAAAPSTPVPEIVAPTPDIAAREVPDPQVSPQPLTVTPPVNPEPPVFELPPTTPPSPVVAAPELSRTPPIRVVNVPEPVRAPRVEISTPQLAVDPVTAPTPSVAQRDVPTPVRLPAIRAPAPVVDAPSVQVRTPDVARRDVPSPAIARQDPAATSPSQAAPSTRATPSPAAGADASRATQPAGPPVATRNPGVGTGPQATPAPGSWATPRRADDWGESNRNNPGRGDGVFDGDGRPRIAPAPGSAAPGRPPGIHTEEIANLDRAGTWLKRKALPYEPTRFDRFWRPNETLLQEWVRRGIKQVSIPIPGSGKRIVCGISILQLGGGCWAEDPNVNEQPATARPPPDIPFKPHLQEDPGTTIPPGTPPGSGGGGVSEAAPAVGGAAAPGAGG